MSTRSQPFPPEELFEHIAFVRRIARGLLRDEHLAEDVAQEALVAALEHPPREPGALRAWLSRTARNLALNLRQSASRRERREALAARPEHVEPSEEASERLELERFVFDQVLALDEAKRTVVFLRYHEGLEPVSIAARLGLPVKTVKTRLARGLAELRERLERRHGGDQRALALALAKLAHAPLGTAAFGAGLAVKWGLAAALGATLVLAWQGTRPSPATKGRELGRIGDRTPYEYEEQGNDASSQAAGARESILSAPAAAAVPGAWELAGSVRRREDGSALAGVPVEALFSTAAGIERVRATTDESGSYRFRLTSPATVTTLTARATPATAAAQQAPGQRLRKGQPLALDLWVTRGASLAATVVDEDGRPVSGATVRAWCAQEFEPSRPADRTALTAADGSFRLEHLGEEFTLTADAEGRVCLYGLRGHLAPDAEAEGLSVTLSESARFRGHVVDARGRPVSGAHLASRPHGEASSRDATPVAGVRRFYALDVETTTDSNGAFELGPVPSRVWNVSTTHPGFLLAHSVLDPRSDDNVVELQEGYGLRGRVLGWDGKPLPGARVEVEPQAGESRSTTTDAEGLFEVAALTATENGFVLVVADGHALLARQPVRIGPDGERFLELCLERPSPLAGRVLSAAGRPVEDALVRAEGERLVEYEDVDFGERTTWEWAADRNTTRTDADGRFRFSQLYAGRFELLVSPPDAPELHASFGARSGNEDVEILLDHAAMERAVFAGEVSDARTHKPLPAFTVTAMRDGNGTARSFGAEAGGRFRMPGYAPAAYELLVTANGYAAWRGERREYEEGETRHEIALWPACSVSVLVRDERGQKLSLPAEVSFRDLDGRRLWVDHGTWSSDSVSVGQQVEVVAGLPQCAVRVTAGAAGFRTAELELDLSAPPPEPITLVLARDPSASSPDGLAPEEGFGLKARDRR